MLFLWTTCSFSLSTMQNTTIALIRRLDIASVWIRQAKGADFLVYCQFGGLAKRLDSFLWLESIFSFINYVMLTSVQKETASYSVSWKLKLCHPRRWFFYFWKKNAVLGGECVFRVFSVWISCFLIVPICYKDLCAKGDGFILCQLEVIPPNALIFWVKSCQMDVSTLFWAVPSCRKFEEWR